MRKNLKSMTALCMTCGLVMTQMAGCGPGNEANATTASQEQVQETTAEETSAAETKAEISNETAAEIEAAKAITEAGIVTAAMGEGGEKSVTYDPEDMDTAWDEESAAGIVLADAGITVEGEGVRVDGNIAVIEKAGTYVVSGSTTDGQLRIEAGEDELVHLVLNGAELTSKTTSSIYSPEKCKVVLTLEEGTKNVIGDSGEYQFAEGEDEPDATVFTKGDLTINGTGELEVNGTYACGIRSKDDLKVVSGVITLNTADDALKGKDSVVIGGGELNINSGGDGIKSNNDEDPEKGYVWVDGGRITIAAESDGIQAETALVINGGSVEVTKSEEAFEGKSVDILGGVIKAVATDDGINSAGPAETEWEKMQDQEGVYTRIAGGQIWLNASADGIDSNGDLYIDGGELYLTTPVSGDTAIIDYNGTSRITGGLVIAAGSSRMMQVFGQESTQNYMVNYYTEAQAGKTPIQILDADGKELASYAPELDYEAVIISMPELQKDHVYRLVTGETETEVTITDVMTRLGEGGRRGPEGMKGSGRGPGPENGEYPEGMTPPEGNFQEGMTPPEDFEFPEDGQWPEGMQHPEGMERPQRGERPDGMGRDLGRKRPGDQPQESDGEAETTAEAETAADA